MRRGVGIPAPAWQVGARRAVGGFSRTAPVGMDGRAGAGGGGATAAARLGVRGERAATGGCLGRFEDDADASRQPMIRHMKMFINQSQKDIQ